MASFSGPLHRSLSAFAAVSSLQLPDKFSHHKLADPSTNADAVLSLPASQQDASAPSPSCLSGLQFVPRDVQSLHSSRKKIIFHTFSNTGWLCYGVILNNLQKQDPSAVDNIKACVVDSAPVASPDPQVWASGFLAALMKKRRCCHKRSRIK